MGAAKPDWSRLAEIVGGAEATGGTVGVAVVGPDGARYSHNGARRFGAASTVKVPLMVEVYRQIDRGERGLDDPYTLSAADKTPGSGVLLHLHDGLAVTLDDLLYLTISISDNTATNVLIDLAGMDAVNAAMRSLGMTSSTLGRKMKGRPADPGEPENWATPDDYAGLIAVILDHRAASPASCDRMIDTLEKQQNPRRIARYLPEREDLRWGSKTGSVKGVVNDVGFVTTERGTAILSVFCENLPDQHTGEQVIGEISRAALAAAGISEC